MSGYSSDDIRRYLKGEMTSAEMFAFEKTALDDPFLSEAIEGFELALASGGDKVITDDLEMLRRSVETRAGAKLRTLNTFFWLRTAAAAAVVIAAGIFTYKTLLPGALESKQTVQELAIPQTPARSANDNAAPVADTQEMAASAASPAPPPLEKTGPIQPEKTATAPLPGKANDQKKALPERNTTNIPEANQQIREEEIQQPTLRPASDDENVRLKTEKDQSASAAGAVAEKKKTDTVRRFDGSQENNNVADKATAETVNALPPSPKLRRQNGRESSLQDTSRLAAPVTGWKAFYEYLDNNKKKEAPAAPGGETIVSFTITASGKPLSPHITRSVNPYYDKEALRLLNEGPSWKLLKGKEAKVSVSVWF